MRAARRALPYALLIAAATLAAWPILRARGMPYNVDISGFFPLSPEAYEGRFWPLWNVRGGMSTLQFLPGLAFELPLLVAGRAMGWGMEAHLKVRIVLGFALAGISMFALARHYVAKRFPRAPAHALVLAPLAAGLLYMLNPWSVHRVFHYFLWIGYAMAPFVVLAFERLAESPTWRRALAFAAIVALATTDPHNPATFAILLAPLALLRLVSAARKDRGHAWRLARAIGLAAGAFVAYAAFWILPYAYNALNNPSFGPTYVMSQQMLDTLSRNGGLLETLRLLHNYLPRGDLWPAGGIALQAWNIASFAVPILAVSALALDRSALAWTYGGIAAAMVLLGMGSQGPIPGGYSWLLFGAPWGEGLSWLFRDPYRWGGIQALAYGVLLALAVAGFAELLSRTRLRMGLALPTFAIVATLVFSGPALASYTNGAYSPVVVPDDYAKANAYLAAARDASTVWMPRALGATTWSGARTLEYFDATSSMAPAMGPFRPHTSTYFDFLADAAKDGADLAPLLARAGADRIMYHNDVDPEAGARAIRQIEQLGLAADARLGNSSTLVMDASSSAPAYTPAARYALYGDRELAQTFVPHARVIEQLSLRVDRVGAPGALRVIVENAAGRTLLARTVTPTDASIDLDVPLGGLRVSPNESYVLRLRAGEPSDGENRFDVSYYTVDAYPEGSLAGAPGDLSFAFFAQARGLVTALVSPAPAPALRMASRAIASPDGLQLLRAVDALPAGSAMRAAPIAFLDQDIADATAFAGGDGRWVWLAGLQENTLAQVVPFLPASSFHTLFSATTSADPKTGWARGTQDFTYYDWGWKRSLSALQQESWDFDGGDGLVYASVPSNIMAAVPVSAESVLLARAYESPDAGRLAFHASTSKGETLVGTIDMRGNQSRFEWVEIGRVPAGATGLRVESLGGLQGIDRVALVPLPAYVSAQRAAAARFATMPVTLLAQAETLPALAARTVAIPEVGRAAQIDKPVAIRVDVPVGGNYSLWLRVPAEAAAPSASLDGKALPATTCAADCYQPARWMSVAIALLHPGHHELLLSPSADATMLDALAVSSDAGFAAPEDAGLEWSRASVTEYRAHVAGGGLLALAVPYDPGWVARIDGAARVRSVPVDGVANGFVLPQGAHDIVISYEPQAWAERGVFVTLAAALGTFGLAGATLWRRRAGSIHVEEALP